MGVAWTLIGEGEKGGGYDPKGRERPENVKTRGMASSSEDQRHPKPRQVAIRGPWWGKGREGVTSPAVRAAGEARTKEGDGFIKISAARNRWCRCRKIRANHRPDIIRRGRGGAWLAWLARLVWLAWLAWPAWFAWLAWLVWLAGASWLRGRATPRSGLRLRGASAAGASTWARGRLPGWA